MEMYLLQGGYSPFSFDLGTMESEEGVDEISPDNVPIIIYN